MSYSQDKYFKTGLKLNMVGHETLDKFIGIYLKTGQSKQQFISKVSVIFGLQGARLTKFLNNIDLDLDN